MKKSKKVKKGNGKKVNGKKDEGYVTFKTKGKKSVSKKGNGKKTASRGNGKMFAFYNREMKNRKNGKQRFANGTLVKFKGIKGVVINHVNGGSTARVLLKERFEGKTRYDVNEKLLHSVK